MTSVKLFQITSEHFIYIIYKQIINNPKSKHINRFLKKDFMCVLLILLKTLTWDCSKMCFEMKLRDALSISNPLIFSRFHKVLMIMYEISINFGYFQPHQGLVRSPYIISKMKLDFGIAFQNRVFTMWHFLKLHRHHSVFIYLEI